ncbi:MAG: hypothetical protein ACK4R2_08125 [Roseateles sp.]
MSKIRQALQLLLGDAGLSMRRVAAALGVGKTTISAIAGQAIRWRQHRARHDG